MWFGSTILEYAFIFKGALNKVRILRTIDTFMSTLGNLGGSKLPTIINNNRCSSKQCS